MALREVMPVPLLLLSTLLLAECIQGTIAAETTVKVSTTPVYPKIPRRQASKDFQVLLRVEAAPESETDPIDLVAVLDVSGSMRDRAPGAAPATSSRLDLLKAAMKFVIRKLGDGDRLAIVPFNDRPVGELGTGLLDMSGDGRSIAGRRVERLKAGGGTAFMPALEEAAKILDGRAADGRNRVGFIILLTDGEDTSGFRWSEIIHGFALSKYPVHTFGLSAAHDPKPLLTIAQSSRGGTYSFVDDGDQDKITGALAMCLGGLTSVVAVDTRVTLESPDRQGGVRIRRIESGGYESRVSCTGDSGDIDVGILYAGEVKNFVVHLHVPPVEGGCTCNNFAICDDHRPHHHQHLLAVSYSHSQAPGLPAISIGGHGLFVQRPDGNDAGQQAPSPAALQHIVQFEWLDIVATTSLVHGEINGYLSLANALQSKWDDFRRAHRFWVGVELAVLEGEVDAMVTGLKHGGDGGGGVGVALVYSWVSSHQMQRATAMGSPENVASEFLTPAMLRMLEEAREVAGERAATAGYYSSGGNTGCACADLETMIDQRLELWAKVKREVPLMYQPPGEEDAACDGESSSSSHHLTAVFRAASLEAIDRAMYHDMYLAVVHTRNQKRCDCHYSSSTDR